MNAFTIGLSALAAGRRALDLTGQNIANASTKGYTRQAANLSTRLLDGVSGAGVDVASISRFDSPTVRTAHRSGSSVLSATAARLETRRQLETVLPAGAGGIVSLSEQFFNTVGQLSARPDDPTVRREVVDAAGALASRFRAAAADVNQLREGTARQIGQTVEEMNDLATRIAELNRRISAYEVGNGGPANDLRDLRDRLIDDLSERIDVRTVNQPHGVVNVVALGTAVVIGNLAGKFEAVAEPDGQMRISQAGQSDPMDIAGGTLGGMMREYNRDLPAAMDRLDALAAGLMRSLNTIQATGLGLNGPLTSAVGTRSVADPSAPLAGQTDPLPLQAGDLVISLTDTASGTRTNATIAIDPATQSLQDVAAAITSGTGGRVQATVDAGTNTLRMSAATGTAFDFAGRPENPPRNVVMGGTAAPVVGGIYTGTTNDNYSFQVVGSGTVGVTQGLTVQVRDAANQVIATVNVGAGYTPGTPIPVGNGITVAIGAGTTTNGSFSAPMIAHSDSADALSGLGVNGLFTGHGAAGLAVRNDLSTDPSKLAAGRSGMAGDASNLVRLAAARDAAAFDNGTRTFSQSATDFASEVGNDVRSLDDAETAQTAVLNSLFAQEQSSAGVDVNEEVVHMLDFQRMIQSASKFISTVNDTLDSILGILR